MVLSQSRRGAAGIVSSLFLFFVLGDVVMAADDKVKESDGVVDKVGTSVKNLAAKIEKEVTGVVKKLEESETPKKVGNELKRSAESLGQKVEEAGKKVKEAFRSE